MGGEEAGTPNRVWLSGADLQTVSPSVESLLVGRAGERVGGVPSFTCDPSRYACRTLPGAPIGAYYRFAALGPSRVVYLVGVLTWDPGAPSASVDQRIGVFDRIIDARLAPIR